MSGGRIVILGAGHGGVQAAASLRDEGYDGAVVLVDSQPHLPYQRPPLSKAFMKGEASQEQLALRGEPFFTQRRIDLALGSAAVAVDRVARRVTLADGARLDYDHLILATGARARPLPLPGAGLDGVMALRTVDDARRLRERLGQARRAAVIGAGFIGLEFAAVAAGLGVETTIIDVAPRVMGRAVSPIMSDAFAAKHRMLGSTLLLDARIAAIQGEAGRAVGVALDDGRGIAADLVVAGVGVLAEDGLARESGLAIENGVRVDAFLTTSDPAISAIGDAASFPSRRTGGRLRLEAVQNALDQARCVAARLVGRPAPYDAIPWFWSDQADFKLQIAGVAAAIDDYVVRGDPAGASFSVFGLTNGLVAVVESVNRAGDHMAARRFLAGVPLTRAEALEESYDLRAHAGRSAARS